MSRAARRPGRRLGSLFSAALVIGALRPAAWRRPLSRDAAQYLYAGGIVADGGVPYRDVALNKGPLLIALYAVVRRLAGTSSVRVRAMLLPADALSVPVLEAWLARLAPRAARPAGLMLAALYSLDAMEGDEPNSEMLATGPALLAGLAAECGAPATSGIALGLAVLINPALLSALPAVSLSLAAPARSRDLRIAARFAAGFGGPVLATLALLTRAGALRDARYQLVAPARVNLVWGAEQNIRNGRARDPGFLGAVPAPELWLAAIVGCGLALGDPVRRRAALIAGTWVAGVWLRVKSNSYEFPHHYQPALPGLCAAIALGADWLAERTGMPVSVVSAAVAAPLCARLVLTPQVAALRLLPWERTATTDQHAALHYPVAQALRFHSRSGERTYVCGSEPAVLWLAERRAPNRLFDMYPLMHHPGYVRERERVLREEPPEFACVMPGASDLDPGLAYLLSHHRYEAVWAESGATILRRID